MDEDGVTEDFQYHDNSLKEKEIELDLFDVFFREAAGPLHLVKLINFSDELDSLLVDAKTDRIDYSRIFLPK